MTTRKAGGLFFQPMSGKPKVRSAFILAVVIPPQAGPSSRIEITNQKKDLRRRMVLREKALSGIQDIVRDPGRYPRCFFRTIRFFSLSIL